MKVALYRVGRNLNRAYRTCEAFGVAELRLVQCTGTVRGRLFGAAGRVEVVSTDELPTEIGTLALETGAGVELAAVDWSAVTAVLLGGESSGLPRRLPVPYAHIPQRGRVSGLTVEAALAIALYEWRQAIPC